MTMIHSTELSLGVLLLIVWTAPLATLGVAKRPFGLAVLLIIRFEGGLGIERVLTTCSSLLETRQVWAISSMRLSTIA